MTEQPRNRSKQDQRERKEREVADTVVDGNFKEMDNSTDYGDGEKTPPPTEPPEIVDESFIEPPSRQGHSGKNILTGTTPLTPEEQKEHVSKSKSTPKEVGAPGRVTQIENELKRQRGALSELNTNITKMMFLIVVLSICLAAYKVGSLVHVGVNVENVIELLIAVLLSYFGVNSTYKYTKQHPEEGGAREQLKEATKEVANDFVEGLTGYVLVKKKPKNKE